MQTIDWTLQNIWNDTLIEKLWPIKPRNYIRASEIGKSYLDRYLQMTGTQFTNPFDARTLRVFEAGNIYEWLVRIVLIRSGLLVSSQKEVTIKDDHHLDVIGHLDFIGGGKPNFEEAAKIIPQLKALYFPTRMLEVANHIIDQLQTKFPDGLPHLLYEVKSVNSLVFWRHNKAMDKAYDHHVLQLYTYLKGMDLPEGRILYISKDDLTLVEVAVIPDEKLEAKWQEDVTTMTRYINTKTKPEPEAPIVWDEEKRGYRPNWMITRSNYFDLIIGGDKDKYDNDMKNLANRANARVKKALELKAELTDEQIQKLVDPYIAGELSGKLHIVKEVVV